jgi:hypothetical protein
LYEMLSGGERPFTGERARTTGSTGEKIRWEQMNLEPPSLRRRNKEISRELAVVVKKCLEKEPGMRYSQVLEFLTAFENTLAVDGVSGTSDQKDLVAPPPIPDQVPIPAPVQVPAPVEKAIPSQSTPKKHSHPLKYWGIGLLAIIGLGVTWFVLFTAQAYSLFQIIESKLATQITGAPASASQVDTPTPTPLPNFTAKAGSLGFNLYDGPGEEYKKIDYLFSDLTIIGQADGCSWFKVTVNSGSGPEDGWVRADQITFSVKCSDVPPADIPPFLLPTPTRLSLPTETEGSHSEEQTPPTCLVNSIIMIANHTGASATLNLKGPASFTFTILPDANKVPVCSGSYDYTITYNCNGNSESMNGRISDGDRFEFACN